MAALVLYDARPAWSPTLTQPRFPTM